MANKTISVMLNAITGPYQAQMGKAAASTQGFSAAASGASANVGKVGTSVGSLLPMLAGGAGLGMAVKSVADSAIGWESAFAGVRKTVDGTETQLAALSDGLLDMSTEIPVAANELAGIAEAAGQLGVETGNIESFTQTMAELGVTTNLSSEEAATSLARFANIMGTSQTDFDRLGSSIVELGNNFETTEAEIVELSQRMAAAGKIAGLSEGDVLGFATALTSVGVGAEAGGTAMSKVFTSINDAVIDGGDKLETFARTADMSVEQFRTAFEDDAAGAISEFIAGLGRVSEAGGSTTAIFEELSLTDQRLMRALLSTASAGDKLTDAVRTGNDAFEENNALQEEAAQRFATTESKMQMARNSIEKLKTEIGQGLLPVIGEAASGLTDLLSMGVPGGGGMDLSELMGLTAANMLDPHAAFGRVGQEAQGRVAAEAQRQVDALAKVDAAIRGFVSDGIGSFLDAAPKWAAGLSDAAGASDGVSSAQDDMAMFVEDANEDLTHQISLFRELSADPVDRMLSALDSVEEAQSAFNDALEGTVGTGEDANHMFETQAEKTAAVESAAWDLYLANLSASEAADMAAGKYGDVEQSLMGMFEAGLINNDQLDTLLGLLDDTRDAAETWERTYTMILDADLSPMQRKLNNLRNQGFHVAIPGVAGAGGITMHTGGVVGGDAGRMPGLAADERLRVLQVGERVIPAGQVTSGESRGASSSTHTEVNQHFHGPVTDHVSGRKAAHALRMAS